MRNLATATLIVFLGPLPSVGAQTISLYANDGLKLQRSESPPKFEIIAPAASAEAIDGDTFWLSVFKIRLKGIDAIEPKQTCRLDGNVQCAEQVRRELIKTLGLGEVRCEVDFAYRGKPSMDRNRYLATCFAGAIEVNKQLVADGWAFADEARSVPHYYEVEKQAETAKRGLHQYVSERPWVFRKNNRVRIAIPISDCNALETMCRAQPKRESQSLPKRSE